MARLVALLTPVLRLKKGYDARGALPEGRVGGLVWVKGPEPPHKAIEGGTGLDAGWLWGPAHPISLKNEARV